MKKAKLVSFEDLTEDEKLGQPNNGSGKEYASYIVVEDEKGRRVYSDAMEPEDASFGRNLSWILEELNVNSKKRRIEKLDRYDEKNFYSGALLDKLDEIIDAVNELLKSRTEPKL